MVHGNALSLSSDRLQLCVCSPLWSVLLGSLFSLVLAPRLEHILLLLSLVCLASSILCFILLFFCLLCLSINLLCNLLSPSPPPVLPWLSSDLCHVCVVCLKWPPLCCVVQYFFPSIISSTHQPTNHPSKHPHQIRSPRHGMCSWWW